MGKLEQGRLTLVGGLHATHASALKRLMEAINWVDKYRAPKRNAMLERLGIRSESHLSEALCGDKHFPLDWLPGYVEFDDEERIGNELASWRGSKLVPLRPRTPAQQLRNIERVLAGMGAAGDFIRDQADRLPDEEEGS